MTGRLLLVEIGEAPGRFERVRLGLDDGQALVFADVRKFGRLELVPESGEPFGHLGPEPLERGFTASCLRAALAARRRALKPLLLDQAVVAGLGNIYVDESLHRAGLHPLERSDRVTADGARRLRAAIRSVLSTAIRREGSSFDTFYRTPEGQPGRYQERFRVYGREGLPCRTCRTAIVRTVVGQRGTHHCPRCQPRLRRPRLAQ
jgi:formamidopyrimidine-DNA glycosylase